MHTHDGRDGKTVIKLGKHEYEHAVSTAKLMGRIGRNLDDESDVLLAEETQAGIMELLSKCVTATKEPKGK
jgi:hypothetical protein